MKTQDELFTMLKDVLIEDFEIEEDAITTQAHLYEDLDLDSIDAIDLVVKLRELTGKKIEAEAFKKVRTVDDVLSELHALLN
ncbi:acyl carrier protein [Alteromonas sp. C1M14]|uniref:acyl carrier protein n=1 Tax=Alteromonas sp. C1M14 TaxID=2841567 RepID=UPI001C086520|nr:acyl carrier protein [Alteromonas sp. C1M14]MBU2979656.1 acyl carrier protein [Alteromonas sp. C1M14]